MNTKILPKLAMALTVIVAIAVTIWLIKPNSNNNNQNQQALTTNLPDNNPSTPIAIDDSCQPKADKNWTYQVNATVDTTTNKQPLYQSNISFMLDFLEQSQQVKGLASDIQVQENGQASQSVLDVSFLAFNQSSQYAQFGFFDDLGLTANHPMKLLNPLIKQLSVAADGENVVYDYDSMSINYHYTHTFPKVERTANGQADTTTQWQVTLGSDCLIETLQAIEQLPFKFGTTDAVMTYQFTAKRVPSKRSLDSLNFAANVNTNNHWKSTVIDDTAFSPDITSHDMMQQAFENFSNTRSTGQLKKAAAYLMANNTPEQVSDMLMQSEMSEAGKRELAFSLSIAEGDHVQDYILNTLSAMPAKTDAQGEVQKVRLLVALSGRNDVNAASFDRLMALRNDATASDNLKKNVLISGGKLAQDLAEKGQVQALNTLENTLKPQLQKYDDNAASAILASGNAGLSSVTPELMNQLSNGTEKSRYAAATVLAREPANHDMLISHLTKEPSLVVFQSTVSGLGNQQLNNEQQTKLQALKTQLQQQPDNEANQEKVKLLNTLGI